MCTTRRTFLKTAGLTALVSGLYPATPGLLPVHRSLPRRSPESQGVDSAGIRAFLRAAGESGLEWHSFMLLRHGAVVGEGWWKPFEPSFKHTLYSLSKSFTSSAIGFLVAEGRLTVDDPVLGFFPDEAPAAPGEHLAAMRVKHLLTMNTGHDSDTLPVMRGNERQSWVKSFLEHSVVHAPGTHFLYNTGATYMLGAIVHRLTGLLLEDYLALRLFRPLGIEGYDWEKSPDGLNTAGYGLRIRTEDIARFGQLYLQKGAWNGRQLLPEA